MHLQAGLAHGKTGLEIEESVKLAKKTKKKTETEAAVLLEAREIPGILSSIRTSLKPVP